MTPEQIDAERKRTGLSANRDIANQIGISATLLNHGNNLCMRGCPELMGFVEAGGAPTSSAAVIVKSL